jgi:hypothetical protein
MPIILGRSFEVSAYTPEVMGLKPGIIFELVHRTRFLKLRIACRCLVLRRVCQKIFQEDA